MRASSPTHHRPWLAATGTPGRVTDYGRLLVGLIVVSIGVLFLLESAGVLDAGRALDHWWPVALIAAGAFTLAERPPSIFRGTLLAGVGVVLLLFTTDVLGDDAWAYVWPALVVLAGLVIVARWSGLTAEAATPTGDDTVRATAVFGGQTAVSASPRFRGAWLTAVFGGVTLDLRGARPDPDGASVNATAAFGGVDVLVPHGWRISVRSTPIFGGVDDKTDHDAPVPDDAPTLRVDAVTLFGGVDVKHEK